MSDTDKNNIIKKVVESIMSLPIYMHATLMSKETIFKKLKRDIYGKNGIDSWVDLILRKNDQQWIEARRTDLNETYDVEAMHSPALVNLVSPNKRKKPEGEQVCNLIHN